MVTHASLVCRTKRLSGGNKCLAHCKHLGNLDMVIINSCIEAVDANNNISR